MIKPTDDSCFDVFFVFPLNHHVAAKAPDKVNQRVIVAVPTKQSWTTQNWLDLASAFVF